MKQYTTYQMEVEGHKFWVAESVNHFQVVVGQGDTKEEAIAELEENEKVFLETIKELGWENENRKHQC